MVHSVQDIFATLGNMRWGTSTDVQMLSDILGIGFVIFADRPQDGPAGTRFVCSVDSTRGDYAYWMFLYFLGESHFQLCEVKEDHEREQDQRWLVFCKLEDVPRHIKSLYDASNAASPMGSAYRGGIT